MQSACDLQVVLQIFLTGLQSGDAPATEFIEKMDPRGVVAGGEGELRG